MKVGVPSSELKLKGDEMIATDEAEAVAIAVGYYLATGKTPIVFMGSNGFLNALEYLTSLVIPYKIPIKWVIGVGREEEWHEISSKTILNQFNDYKGTDIQIIRKD